MDADNEYFRGTISEYRDRDGYGYIEPDSDQGVNDSLLVHRRSLRDRQAQLRRGDRVLFRLQHIDRGALASDVHLEAESVADAGQPVDQSAGVIKMIHERGFGFIRLDSGSEAFFHVSYLTDPDTTPQVGSRVAFRLIRNQQGFVARDIVLEDPPASGQDWLAQAIIARDAGRHDEAAALYERGLRSSPTVQLVLSYAAMEKNRNRKRAAMRIYEQGIKIFPDVAKLREDAGHLAASLGDYTRGLELLHEALDLCRRTKQGGEKGVVLEMARIYYTIGRESTLRDCIRYYEEALTLFGRGRTQLPAHHLLNMSLAKTRVQHHRGNVTVEFLQRGGLEIVRANLLDSSTEGAEFVVSIDDPEFKESYGLAQDLVVRCMFKSQVLLQDLEALDTSVTKWSSSGLADDQVALLVVSSLPDDLLRRLSNRIEERREAKPAIVPIQQSDLERSTDPLATLRGLFDRWLYRRDLFAGNYWVQGRRFFGRAKPLAEIRDAIETNTPVGVFGLRKVGKTSLLKETQRRASELGDLVVYVDLLRLPADVSDCTWLYWKLADELRRETSKLQLRNFVWRLGGEFKDFIGVPPSFPVATAFDSDLTRLLQHLKTLNVSPRPKIVILLDEVERLLPNALGKPGFSGFFDFFSYLRGVSQEDSDFVFIVTAANAAINEASQFESRDNPVFNFFKEIYLQLLEPSECVVMMRELGRGMGIRFTTDAYELVYRLTGGHPFFARQVCSFVAEHHRERPLTVTAGMISRLVPRYLDERGSKDCSEIMDRLARDFPDELETCIAIATAGGALTHEEIRKKLRGGTGTTIRHLTGYQIATVSNHRVSLTIDLLTRWLQQRYPNE